MRISRNLDVENRRIEGPTSSYAAVAWHQRFTSL